MNKWIHKLYHRYKRSIIFIAGFFIGIFLLKAAFTSGLFINDQIHATQLLHQRTLSDSGKYDINYYNIPRDPVADAGAKFSEELISLFISNPDSVLDLLNYDLIAERGYSVQHDEMIEGLRRTFHSISEDGYELSYFDYYNELQSGGIIFNFRQIRPSNEETVEYCYDPLDQLNFSLTLYFDGENPVSFLPFAEPAIHSYAQFFGFQKR